jgi:hypothetical protein
MNLQQNKLKQVYFNSYGRILTESIMMKIHTIKRYLV